MGDDVFFMQNKYVKELTVLPGMCDNSGALGIPDTFSLFMDVATEHACLLGCGLDTLAPRGLFWLAVRSRVRFERRPKMFERMTLTTWPEVPGKLRANRDYLLTQGSETLALGKTEWTVLDQNSARLHPTADVFAPELDFCSEAVWDEPFTHMRDEALEEFARCTVRSTDIDLGGHMNNAAYVRMLASLFSCAQWQGMAPRELEIAYRAPCYEGEELIWQRREEGTVLALRAANGEGRTIVLARLVRS